MPKKPKASKKGKKAAPVKEPPPPPPPRVPVWPHGPVPEGQRVEGDVGTAVPEWQRLPAVVKTPPADAKLCYNRFRQSPAKQAGPHSNLEGDLSATMSELSGRKKLRTVVESAQNGVAALTTANIREKLGRQGQATQGSPSELRARMGALAAASALIRIARAEGVGENKIRGARVGDVDGDGVDTETIETLITLIITERENRATAADQAAAAVIEGPLSFACECATRPVCFAADNSHAVGPLRVSRENCSGRKRVFPPHFSHPQPLHLQSTGESPRCASVEADPTAPQPFALHLS
jgi:hypothetical protein